MHRRSLAACANKVAKVQRELAGELAAVIAKVEKHCGPLGQHIQEEPMARIHTSLGLGKIAVTPSRWFGIDSTFGAGFMHRHFRTVQYATRAARNPSSRIMS